MAKRVHDKINCPTNFTSPKTFAVLLDAVKNAGALTSEDARETVFPQARSSVSRYNPENKDTHGEGTLRTYGLIENVPNTTPVKFCLSSLGCRFLECFEKNNNVYVLKSQNEYNYNSVLLDALLCWTDSSGSKTINPGWVLLKLLTEQRLDYYITDYEWAYFCECSDYRNTKDYEELVNTLLSLRKEDIKDLVQPRNAYAFMVGFSGDWDILEKTTKREYNCFCLKEITKRNLREKMHCWEMFYPETTNADKNEEDNPKSHSSLNFKTNIDCAFERNRIVFGAPGTGKSYLLEKDKDRLLTLGGDYERVTFHPDFTYASFVGCYKPVSENKDIKYQYVPGPFMRILVEALRSGIEDRKAKPFLLLIEEINRAKVAAVLGDVFQLLDRNKSGESVYEIHASEDMKRYLSKELNSDIENFKRIKIPNNMFIWASMNSADQGVFPMDTAFKRRWNFEYVAIDENEDKVGGDVILGKGVHANEVNWNILRKAINSTLALKFKVNEDKLLGPFFLGEEIFAFDDNGKIKNPSRFISVFKSKVIMYLYEDAAKLQKHKLFSGCDSSRFSSVCKKFDEIGIEIFGEDFKTTYEEIKESEGLR